MQGVNQLYIYLVSSAFAEHVVAESVVVIKKLLQSKAAEHYEIITQMAKLIDYINVAAARAAIIWLIGEYNEKVPLIAPDVLRKMAKSFVDEQDVVKLQVLNLGVKLYLTNPQQTSLLCQYVFTLARYDTNYDVRDRARFLRQFIFPASGESSVLSQHARQVFLASKPVPVPESKYRDSNAYQLGSLSHYLNMPATGYKELPAFPVVAPDSSVRNIAGYMHEKLPGESPGRGKSSSSSAAAGAAGGGGGAGKEQREKGFLSESEKSSAYSESSGSSSDSSGSSSDSSSGSDSDDDDDEVDKEVKNDQGKEEQGKAQKKTAKVALVTPVASNKQSAAAVSAVGNSNNNNNNNSNSNAEADAVADSGTSDSDESSFSSGSGSGSSGSDSGSGESGSESEEEPKAKAKETTTTPVEQKPKHKQKHPQPAATKPTKSNLDLLLDLDDIPPIGPVMTPSLGGFLTPGELEVGGEGAEIV